MVEEKRSKTGFSGSQFHVISPQIKPALHSELSVFQSAFLGWYHWYKEENVSFGCLLCIATRSMTLFLKEHDSHTDSQQPLSHLVKFTVEVTMSTPSCFFFLFPFLPLSRQTNMFCVNIYHNKLAVTGQPKQITDKIPLST